MRRVRMTPLKETENEWSQRMGEYTGASCKPREGRLGVSRDRGCQQCHAEPGEDRNAPEQRTWTFALLPLPVSFGSCGRSGAGEWEVREQSQSIRKQEASGGIGEV